MISNNIKQKLRDNWGERAEALECYAEVKFIDPLSSWCCYVIAMDEEMLHCIFYSDAMGVEVGYITLNDLNNMYNEEGEAPQIDKEYRPMKASTILRRYNVAGRN